MCAYAFCGPDHMVFATDTPYDNELGAHVYRETIASTRCRSIKASRFKIWEGNAAGYFDCPADERRRWSRSRAEVDQGEA
jgi:protocatechuate 3,4-dioxygenase beta subunit